MTVLPYGDAAWLVELEDPAGVLTVAAAARREPGVLEVVPAARTLLVQCDPRVVRVLGDRLAELAGEVVGGAPESRPAVVLDVRYDGADLSDTAELIGMSTEELVRRHSAREYVVAFCGFTPGFAY